MCIRRLAACEKGKVRPMFLLCTLFKNRVRFVFSFKYQVWLWNMWRSSTVLSAYFWKRRKLLWVSLNVRCGRSVCGHALFGFGFAGIDPLSVAGSQLRPHLPSLQRLPPVLPSPARSGCSRTGPGSPRSWRKKTLRSQVNFGAAGGLCQKKRRENDWKWFWWRIMVCLTGGLTLRRGRLTVPSLYFRKFAFVWQVVPEEWVAWGTLHSKECATHNKNKKRTPQKKQSVNASPYHLLIVQWAKCCSSKSNNENEQTEFEHLETLEQLQDELRQAKAHGAKAQSMVEANESLVKDHAVLKAELGTVPLIWKLRRMKSKSWVQACLDQEVMWNGSRRGSPKSPHTRTCLSRLTWAFLRLVCPWICCPLNHLRCHLSWFQPPTLNQHTLNAHRFSTKAYSAVPTQTDRTAIKNTKTKK